ncbi:hypothetical protein KKI22_00750 [Patescibacteria group bacterium]|nr:hypothetical protein [Patescibacteria group bacterium]
MIVKQARKLIGKEANDMSDKEVDECVKTARFFADILVDKIFSMSKEERKKLFDKNKN